MSSKKISAMIREKEAQHFEKLDKALEPSPLPKLTCDSSPEVETGSTPAGPGGDGGVVCTTPSHSPAPPLTLAPEVSAPRNPRNHY